ncbi:MAG: hypothetical protein AB9897_01255 [Anaerolineaceae bacterium]
MPDPKKDLLNAKTNSDPDLTFDYNELLEEIAAERGESYGERLPGDIDTKMLRERLHISETRANSILNEKCARGELVRIRVLENGARPYVYRKKS